MGRIKTRLIKRVTAQLFSKYPGQFSKDFSENKLIVAKHLAVDSPKLRNTVAGYLTKLVKVRKVKGL